ncbi:hypothetical protein HNQ51_001803 [Inhella inkyongensis]|uniref:T2SS protein K first SAM-like domain-containing protein n=1 Tax=Inhella inkyongensis TaxID=392593 RepID=A0A840S7S5_9BURK|nr:hypothetical protein [Inhella inkyongensis]
MAMVLWVLAGLSVVAAAVASHTYTNAQSVKALRDRVQAERAFVSTRSRVGLLMATGAPQFHSFNGPRGRLFVDGRTLAASDSEWVTVQDARGLVNLMKSNESTLQKLIQLCGAAETEAESLKDSLLDYVDSDDLKRIRGAESFEYRRASQPPPRNSPLLSVDELWRVQGFPAVKDAWTKSDCHKISILQGDGVLNHNTAPAAVLELTGMTKEGALAFVQAREDGLSEALPQARGADSSNPFTWQGSGYVGRAARVTHQLQNVEWCLSYTLELSPSRTAPPWVLHELRVSSCPDRSTRPAAALPAPDHQALEQDPTSQNAVPRLPFNLR